MQNSIQLAPGAFFVTEFVESGSKFGFVKFFWILPKGIELSVKTFSSVTHLAVCTSPPTFHPFSHGFDEIILCDSR